MSRIEKNKAQFCSYLRKVDREGIEELITWLEESDFFTAPASTKYHGNYPGGLCEHSLGVLRICVALTKLHKRDIDNATIIVASLLHDLVKVNFYNTWERNVKDDAGKWYKQKNYGYTDIKHLLPHGLQSVQIASRFINLTEEEMLAITYHMGTYDGLDDKAMKNAIDKYPLVLLLQHADMQQASFYEKTYKVEEIPWSTD